MRACVLLALAGCLEAHTTICEDGSVCPLGNVCDVVHHLCITPDQQNACDAIPDFVPCHYEEIDGTCHDGVCFESICGNGRMDVGEACDDGDTESGDHCSADCRSTEVCGNDVVDLGEQCDPGDTRDYDGCSHACRTEIAHWFSLESDPPVRERPMATYDPVREAVVLVGGHELLPMTAFERTHGLWRAAPTSFLPPTYKDAGFAYVPGLHACALFGGEGINGPTRDLWLWDGATWTRGPDAPAPHTRVMMAYDAKRDRLVAYGGYSFLDGSQFQPNNETLELAGTTWSVAVDGTDLGASPPPRSAGGFAYEPNLGAIVLHGGHNEFGPPFGDTWIYDGAWSELPAAGGPAVRWAAMAYSPALGKIVLFGGNDGTGPRDETWLFDPVAKTWSLRAGPNPPAREMATLVADGSDLLLVGKSPEVWRLDATGWSLVDHPAARSGAVATTIEGERTVVYGGALGDNTSTTETWELFPDGWHAADKPGPTCPNGEAIALPMLARDPIAHAVLFGGKCAQFTEFSDATFTWDGSTWSGPVAGEHPIARSFAGFAFDEDRHETVLFGGAILANPPPHLAWFGDTWTWNGTAWTARSPDPAPAARRNPALAFDPISRRTIMYGGVAGDEVNPSIPEHQVDSLIWSWDGNAWSSKPSKGDIPLQTPSTQIVLVWNAARHAMTLLVNGNAVSAYELADDTWTRVPAIGMPAPRAPAAIAPSLDGTGPMLLFGYENGTAQPFGNVLRLRFEDDPL